MQEYIFENFDSRFKDYIADPEVEFNGSYYNDTEWALTGKTRPLTAQEVLKIKYANDVYSKVLINLIDDN